VPSVDGFGARYWHRDGEKHRGGDLPAVVETDGMKQVILKNMFMILVYQAEKMNTHSKYAERYVMRVHQRAKAKETKAKTAKMHAEALDQARAKAIEAEDLAKEARAIAKEAKVKANEAKAKVHSKPGSKRRVASNR